VFLFLFLLCLSPLDAYLLNNGTSGTNSGGSEQQEEPSSLERVKRGWVWNQFFVVEEYTDDVMEYVLYICCFFLVSTLFFYLSGNKPILLDETVMIVG
uniref:Uncharacterized protein n=1 Tax=Xiphophorus couchianus TaxID=32473 RepID=A0A3B5M4X3_9TELE